MPLKKPWLIDHSIYYVKAKIGQGTKALIITGQLRMTLEKLNRPAAKFATFWACLLQKKIFYINQFEFSTISDHK